MNFKIFLNSDLKHSWERQGFLAYYMYLWFIHTNASGISDLNLPVKISLHSAL